MYRHRSTDVWFNLPGVVAAYQPIAAPDPFAARQNVSNDARRAGVHSATPGTAPTWLGPVGWQFANGQHLVATGVTFTTGFCMLVRYSNAEQVSGLNTEVCGGRTAGTNGLVLLAKNNGALPGYLLIYTHGASGGVGSGRTSGVFVIQNGAVYENGTRLTSPAEGVITGSPACLVGGVSGIGATNAKNIQAFAVYSRSLSATEAISASRQVAYCEQNPDWSAWGRRRRYYYAPSVEAVRWRGIGRNDTPVSGRISTGRPI